MKDLRGLITENIHYLLSNSKAENAAAVFEETALDAFRYQYKYNAFYQRYCSLIGKAPAQVEQVADIPFLPIQFFKSQLIQTQAWLPEKIFSSSGTTGAITSQHAVRDVNFYKNITQSGFEEYYGAVKNFSVLGLLPAYLEREGSSLVTMVADFIEKSDQPHSGFFLYNHADLYDILLENKQAQRPTLLLGVSFALLDFVETYQMDFPELIVMETGGMKGRRREITRTELHQAIQKGFNTQSVHSEYGMTELLSQGYSKGNGIFHPTATLRVLTREVNDPLSILTNFGRLGVLNIVDLCNVDTCCFIATDDLGRCYHDGSFEVLGRLDNSDVRGCNLMVGE